MNDAAELLDQLEKMGGSGSGNGQANGSTPNGHYDSHHFDHYKEPPAKNRFAKSPSYYTPLPLGTWVSGLVGLRRELGGL